MAKIKITGKILSFDGLVIENGKFTIETRGLPVADSEALYRNFAYVKSDAEGNVKNSKGEILYLAASDDPEVSVLCHFNFGGGYFFPFLLSLSGGAEQDIQTLRLAGGTVSAGDTSAIFINQQIMNLFSAVNINGGNASSEFTQIVNGGGA